MEGQLTSEKMPQHQSMLSEISATEKLQEGDLENLTEEELFSKVENILLDKIKAGDKQAIFQLGQFYFEQELYEKAAKYFERIKDTDCQAAYQLGVILYDGLAGEPDQRRGFELMRQVATDESGKYKHLKFPASYNVGLAYFQGYGDDQSDNQAEKWFLSAAEDGNPKASVKAQTALGLYYSRPDTLDLSKAFFWHSEACGNGSLESQGALGIMYKHGLGVKKDMNSAFECLREAAERGNVYAMGHLVEYYYTRKLHTKAADLASKVASLRDIEKISSDTDCLPSFIAKGIAMAAFYFARCLHLGHGVKPNKEDAKKYYARAYEFDSDVCARLQGNTQHGSI